MEIIATTTPEYTEDGKTFQEVMVFEDIQQNGLTIVHAPLAIYVLEKVLKTDDMKTVGGIEIADAFETTIITGSRYEPETENIDTEPEQLLDPDRKFHINELQSFLASIAIAFTNESTQNTMRVEFNTDISEEHQELLSDATRNLQNEITDQADDREFPGQYL